MIDIDHNSTVDNDNQVPQNQNSTNNDSVVQLHLQSDQIECDMEDVILNGYDMLSNDILHIE